jgi:hypothetical protein
VKFIRSGLLLSALLQPLWAGSGAVSPDGVFVARAEESSVMVMNLATCVETELTLPPGFKVEWPCLAVTKTLLLVGNERQLMGLNPATHEWSEIFSVPKERILTDIAVNPKTGVLLLATKKENEESSAWWILEPGKKEPGRVFNRRAGGAEAPVFDHDGNLYFCREGDIWKGSIEASSDGGQSFVVLATRIWPIAEKETYNGTPMGVSASSILPLPSHLIVARTRTHGSGWGTVIRLPNQDAYEKQLPLKWDELEDCSSGANPALAYDGEKAFIYIHSSHRWWEADLKTGELMPAPNHPIK